MDKILFFFLILLYSCKGKPKLIPQENNQNKTEVSLDSFPKRYNIFFQKFSNDSLFQKKRLKDSVAFFTNENEINNKLKVTYYNKDDFYFVNFIREDSLARIKEFNKYKTETLIRIDSVTYFRYGIDNGIYMYYVFKRNKFNDWYLTSIHDYSN
ncbi:DUF4348 domain-containing protein [Tenacibaculum finnmarkense genomovar finnmarkense]|uniref:DUF4348 domain-containing protein n=1 Tax=Tenacibaculum finnmarkense TaxID=2781243 RepID=UPI001E5EE339|nr:DUF4348 domain-containing protein [Tenacibaculum finnmarkense]MCD8418585.1 DUF4348 domain-containing protein [Tenacibaculum finnmarkense genomovar finnmarkense]MCG8186943.1 DUF4348 domain-containing protein [Tenacibaculum finnmarkense genomovar finnmarkense]MCG8203425.1 DUF4348 domain-containing protein [Tenacibaculum finnmarkense genomovar finnmarkense]MCG8210978.1 DUF4348 domain-containing protein [Tenacibaculum finnmarkense genomovar finnmarkense]MCG8213751.1 DUF4348 domain-containing pr